MDSANKIRWRYTTVIIIASLIIGGLLFLILSLSLHEGFLASVSRELATALLVGGVWAGAYEFLMRRDFTGMQDANTNRIISKIETAENEHTLGLSEAMSTCERYDYSTLILNSKSLTIVLNDGRTWASWNTAHLKRRFADPEKDTVVILLHPDSPLLPIMAHKLGMDVISVRMKIAETVRLLNGTKSENTKLKILGHDLFSPHSAYLGDSYLVMTPYFFSRARSIPPLFKLQDVGGDCYFRRSLEDIRALELDCRDISKYELLPAKDPIPLQPNGL